MVFRNGTVQGKVAEQTKGVAVVKLQNVKGKEETERGNKIKCHTRKQLNRSLAVQYYLE